MAQSKIKIQKHYKYSSIYKFILFSFFLSVTASFYSVQAALQGLAAAPQFQNWGLHNPISNSHVHILDAWKIEQGRKGVVVAVIDTGIAPEHPDIKSNLWQDPKSKTKLYGWDFVKNKPNPLDEHGHGTHVAGILGAAVNHKSGTAGVAPQISIMPVKYYSDKNTGAENLANSVKALHWAINHGAQIINYSGGGAEFSASELAALQRARDNDILVVAAAGNERQDITQPQKAYYPCAYNLENIICVTAIDIRNNILPSSNWGKTRVDVAAPGENILSTVPSNQYAKMTGTSQATAFVSGLAALLRSKSPTLKAITLRDIIRSSVDRIPALKDKVLTGGKINALAALQLLDKIQRTQILPAKAVTTIVTKKTDEKALKKKSLRKISSKTSAKK